MKKSCRLLPRASPTHNRNHASVASVTNSFSDLSFQKQATAKDRTVNPNEARKSVLQVSSPIHPLICVRKKVVPTNSASDMTSGRLLHFHKWREAVINPRLPKTNTAPYRPTQYLKFGSPNSPMLCMSWLSRKGYAVSAKVPACMKI